MRRVIFILTLIVAFVVIVGLISSASTDLTESAAQPTLTADEKSAACDELIALLSITFGGPWTHDCSPQIEAHFLMVSKSTTGSRLFITDKLLEVNPCGESLSMGPHGNEGLFVYLCGYGGISQNKREGKTYSFFITSI